tara:strand:- start:11095 stop:11745 length:651 start_codon:yes stop_codon:yes gene_type:complete
MRLKFLPSFVKRRGRITKNQEENLKFISDYSIKNIDDIKSIASDYSSCCLEVGFGNAEHIYLQATENPEILFIGSEVYLSGIGTLIGLIKDNNIMNIRIFSDDIRILLDRNKNIRVFDAVKIICPDPWPKERHHKRRLINKSFLELLHSSMKSDANLYISTDWENYADQIGEGLNTSKFFKKSDTFFAQKNRLTKFEQRGVNEGRRVFEFNFKKED